MSPRCEKHGKHAGICWDCADEAGKGPPWLSDAAEALGEVRPSDGAPLALNWTQVIAAIHELREDRDHWRKRAESAEYALALREGEQGMAAALRRERDLALREALEDVAAVRTASARLCRCGSGAHPRRCELHPLAYDAHCARLRHAQEDEERARREALEEATAVCECVETVGLAEGASYCAALLRALLAGEAAP